MIEKEIRWWDPIVGGALILIVVLAAYALEQTYWTYDLNRITSIAFLGVLSGLLIGQSKFKQKTAVILVCIYAFLIFNLRFTFALSNDPFWLNRYLYLLGRIQSTIRQVQDNVPLDDGIIFLLLMAFLFCITSITAGYSYTRSGKPWLPLGIIISAFYTIQIFISPVYRGNFIIILFSFLIILIIGRLQYLHQKEKWTKNHYKQDNEVSILIINVVLFFAFIFSFVSWGIPFFSNKYELLNSRIEENSTRSSSRYWERIKNILNPLRSQRGFGGDLFAEILPLGIIRSIDDSPVFQVQITEDTKPPARYYWRARTYSQYNNGYWENDTLSTAPLDQIVLKPYLTNEVNTASYLFKYQTNRKDLITPQITLGIDRDTEVAFYQVTDIVQDMVDFMGYELIHQGDQITVIGGYYDFVADDLTLADADFPEWINGRYLDFPGDIFPKIQELSLVVTQNEVSIFDQVMAVTDYLRSSFQYTDEVDLPKNVDPIEWFLFEGQEGFCNYYASAGVMMLRSIGIPSRLVVGFSQGEQLLSEQEYLVKKKDSHSWIEVFFPGQGWIIFEPTPSQPRVEYALERDEGKSDENGELIVKDDPRDNLESNDEVLGGNRDFLIDEPNIVNPEQDTRKNFWFILISTVVFCLGFFIHDFFFREKPFHLPIKVEKYLDNQQIKIPRWISRWSEFEQKAPIEKNYQIIKVISNSLQLSDPLPRTPKEFLTDLFSIINLNLKLCAKFIDEYHRQKFSIDEVKYTKGVKQIYYLVVRLMLKKKSHIIYEKIRFRS